MKQTKKQTTFLAFLLILHMLFLSVGFVGCAAIGGKDNTVKITITNVIGDVVYYTATNDAGMEWKGEVRFDSNGGKAPDGVTKIWTSGKQYLNLVCPYEKENCEFVGWSFEKAGDPYIYKTNDRFAGYPLSEIYQLAVANDKEGDLTFYAIWRQKESPKSDAPGGNGGIHIYNEGEEINIIDNTQPQPEATPYEIRYHLNLPQNAEHYIKNLPTDGVAFDQSARVACQACMVGQSLTLLGDIYSVPGWDFLGWSRTPNGAVEYTAEDLTDLFSDRPASDLYAVWELDPYTVGQNVATGATVKGTIADSPEFVVYNQATGLPRFASKNAIFDFSELGSVTLKAYNENTDKIDSRIDLLASEYYLIGDPKSVYTCDWFCFTRFHIDAEKTVHMRHFTLETTSSVGGFCNYNNGFDVWTIGTVVFDVSGTCKVKITAANSGPAISLSGQDVTITGSGTLTAKAGDGLNGAKAGESGRNGGIAIASRTLTVDGSVSVTAIGGNGGSGAKGADGTKGKDGDYGANVDKNGGGHGKAGEPGTPGGRGGDGGVGGYAAVANNIVCNANLYLIAGDSGAGGDGGRAGDGGRGGDAGRWYNMLSCGAGPGNGGDGGRGGAGGLPGAGGEARSACLVFGLVTGNVQIEDGNAGANGNFGKAGSGGAGGRKGEHTGVAHSCYGSDGRSGSKGIQYLTEKIDGTSKYLVFSGGKNWMEADSFANQVGGKLASVDNDFVKGLIKESGLLLSSGFGAVWDGGAQSQYWHLDFNGNDYYGKWLSLPYTVTGFVVLLENGAIN